MLSAKVLTRSEISKAGNYYSGAADDYYTRDMDATAWQGKGAETLGLAGTVDRKRFEALLSGQVQDGVHIPTGSINTKAKQRIGIDLTFSAPKSVSIQALIGDDARLIRAHEEAVAAAIAHAERLAQARTKSGGAVSVEDTGNLVVAKFRHETSRLQDPQLHTHAVVLNMTQRADGQWRALRNDKLVHSVTYMGAYYRAELAKRVSALGYELRYGRDGTFELAKISRAQIDAFSKRSDAIEAALSAKGKDRESATTADKQAATMHTRPHKEHADRAELHKQWQATAHEFGIDLEPAAASKANGTADPATATAAEAAMEKEADNAARYAVSHLTERQAIVNHGKLMDVAIKQGMGKVTAGDVQKAVVRMVRRGQLIKESPSYRLADGGPNAPAKTAAEWALYVEPCHQTPVGRPWVDDAIASGRLTRANTRYTTPAALNHERAILNLEREGRGAVAPIMARSDAEAHLAATNLNPAQQRAAAAMVSATDAVMGVQGLAGTGKTTMLANARKLAEAGGYTITAIAPYGAQVKNLQREGFDAKTAMAFVKAKDKGIDSKTLIVVDEAGVMPTRLMERVLRIAHEAGARVVLVGDTGQTKAIEAGRPFDQLQRAGMATVALDQIIRQRDPTMKEAVEHAAHGQAVEALAKIRDVQELKDDDERWTKVAHDYMALPDAQRADTLIVSGTNAARRGINALVREAEGTAGKGLEYDTLIRRDTTRAERRYSKNYDVGDVIQPERNYSREGLKRGETYKVVENGPGNELTVADKDGNRIAFTPMRASNLSVYTPERSEFAPGDRVRITRNNAGLDVANGDRFTVTAVAADKIELARADRRLTLPVNGPVHLDYANATTVHSSQGLTAERVLYEADSHSLTTRKEVFYVAISRARERAAIYTNDATALPEAVAQAVTKHAALDLHREHRSLADRELAKPQIGITDA